MDIIGATNNVKDAPFIKVDTNGKCDIERFEVLTTIQCYML